MSSATLPGFFARRDAGAGESEIGERNGSSRSSTALNSPRSAFFPPPAFELDSITGLSPKVPVADDLANERNFLLPGQMIITNTEQQITTLLGSCVTVTMFDPRFRAAAICHAMLPQPSLALQQSIAGGLTRFKYISEAVPAMITHFRDLGSAPSQVVVKIFGGANLLSTNYPASRRHKLVQEESVGDANLRFARQILEAALFCVASFNVGGTKGRKIIFNTNTGDVLHRFLN